MSRYLSATTIAAAGLFLSAVVPASAALESDVAFSPLPEVQLSYNDVTSSVTKRSGCNEVKATILVDEQGRMVALLYTSDPEASC
ncbi:hypothetical protein LJR030_001455 [Rhizobium sp. LjRoot30]|uniref:hypothetical protein n=1 Tax=Rhizobium sp. LjRoot30 TaxID=3342320 RepID=UPI003ECE0E60